MANTYQFIASSSPTSDATSVLFSSIPQTYTDLVVRWSSRQTGGGTFTDSNVYINSEGGANYSWVRMSGAGTAPTGTSNSAAANWSMNNSGNNGASTANTFSSHELYLPNYTSSTVNKFGIVSHYTEANATTAYINLAGLLRSATAAITSIGFGSGFATGTTFWLYGIKKN